MTKGIRFLAVLLMLVMGAAGMALAQGADPAQNGPAPKNPARQTYENDTIMVVIQAPDKLVKNKRGANYGYRIGATVTIEVAIVTPPNVAVNVDNLMRGRFDPQNGSDFELASPPEAAQFDQEGRKVTVVKLKIRSWVMKPYAAFNTVFMYALDLTPDGQPNWKPAMSPDFIVTFSRTAAENSADLDEGDLSIKVPPTITFTQYVRYVAYGILLGIFGYLSVLLYRRLNPPREKSVEELAWIVFDDLSPKAANGLSYAEAGRIAAALRKCFKVESVVDEKEMSVSLAAFFEKNEKRFELARVGTEAFAILDQALYVRPDDESKPALTPEQARELFVSIERLVPRP